MSWLSRHSAALTTLASLVQSIAVLVGIWFAVWEFVFSGNQQKMHRVQNTLNFVERRYDTSLTEASDSLYFLLIHRFKSGRRLDATDLITSVENISKTISVVATFSASSRSIATSRSRPQNYASYEDAVALRNSHDKRFPVGIGFGGRVFCCDNLSFYADHVIRRKHTANAKRDLPGLVGELVEPLTEHREAQHRTFKRYRQTVISDQSADHAILSMYRQGIINVTRIADVVTEWEEPRFEEFQAHRTAWRLFNAATFALNGRIAENPSVTRQLHNVIDGVCEIVH